MMLRSGERRIRDDLGVEFIFSFDTSTSALNVEWEPAVPRNLTRQEITLYRAHRAAFIDRVQRETGIELLVVEL